MTLRPTRRTFLAGSAAAAAALAAPRFGLAAFDGSTGGEVLVVLFLRGGVDGLNLVPPLEGADRARYEAARPRLAVPAGGTGAALELDRGFGFHPALEPLLPVYQAGRLAVVLAAGMNEPTRSHFEAQDFMELGTPGIKNTPTGWLQRHLATLGDLPARVLVPSMAVGSIQPLSLLGNWETLTVEDVEYFTFATGPWQWNDAQRTSLRRICSASTTETGLASLQAMNAVDIVEAHSTGDYRPAGGAVYPEDGFGRSLELVARMIRADVGLRVVTADLDGWDTHETQGDGSGGYFAELAGTLGRGLAAFFTDMEASGHAERVTLVAMTEFGRRLAENADGGTDHGHAAPMLVLGGRVVGGVHGPWPGLARDQLFEGIDLEVATDYRRVLSEILVERMGNPRIGEVFPGYEGYEPLGIVEPHEPVPPRRAGGILR